MPDSRVGQAGRPVAGIAPGGLVQPPSGGRGRTEAGAVGHPKGGGIGVIPVLVFVALAQRQIVRGLPMGAVKKARGGGAAGRRST